MKISKIAEILELEYSGNDFEMESFSTLLDASEKNIVFFDDAKLIQDLKKTKARVILTTKEFVDFLPNNIISLVCDNPHLSFAILSKYFAKNSFDFTSQANINRDAHIGANVQIGSNSKIEAGVVIYPNVTIGQNVNIGENSVVYPNSVIYANTIIGKNCILQAGVILGSDGFGYAHTKKGEHIKIYHNGNVILENDVEIGANSTVDRAVFGTTVIKKGTKIDNLVQIGHNCELGEYCIMVSQSGLAGSTKLGRNVIMGGQSAAAGHLKIGDFAVIAARGGVTKTLEGGKTYGGFPLMLQKEWLKQQVKITKFFKNNKRI
ncbi:MAG: UDP-3-O-(3-hydroxymyristoyl)glucosamine N-acyltransferase [Epsilonproteobacteria bacterium]|nr:UDP-3-O-(3-hydroxymyristoyl)glucosamine N-acyltransferase [Campylobacterota bacterium]